MLLRSLVNLPLVLIYIPLMAIQDFAYLFMPKRLFQALQKQNREKEVAKRLKDMQTHVKSGDMVLDVGAGSGDFSKIVAQHLDAKVTGVDVIDYRDSDIEIAMFDGEHIPFPDKSQDVVYAAFVLHHTRKQKELLTEMRRVARRCVIIHEDTYFSPWQRLFVCWNDFHSNILVGFIKALKESGKIGIVKMPMPLTFRTVSGWQKLFTECGYKLKATQVRHASVKPMSKVAFVLEV